MDRKVSIAIGAYQQSFGDKEALNIAKRIGADAVDMDICGGRFDCANPNSIYSKSEDEAYSYFEDLGKYAREIGIEIGQTHGRISGLFPDEETAENEKLFKNFRLDCLATKALGCPVTVVHGCVTGRIGDDKTPASYMRDKNFYLFTEYLKSAKEFGIKVASESLGDCAKYNCCDFFGNTSELIMSGNRVCAIDDNADYFGYCIDTGHANKATRFNNNPSPADHIRMCGGKIIALHLNDNDTLTDQHKVPGTGTIDWKDVLQALDEVGYKGNYNMELNLKTVSPNLIVETGEFAVKVMKNMLLEFYGE